ncbi:MAG: TlpA family protein disulfide reductase [Prevotellaceae bacterium]|nr:TlpA family protein disulfide reductase [Prevotellaceae bacterium]
MKKIVWIAVIFLCGACTQPSAEISGCIGKPHTHVSIVQLNATAQILLDTVNTDKAGCFRYTIPFARKEPTFILLKTDSAHVATLLLEVGEKAKLIADLKQHNYSIEGSAGSLLLQELNYTFNKSMTRFDSLNRALDTYKNAKNYPDIYNQINLELGKVYVTQKREAIRFIYTHPTSFASIVALYQKYSTGLPVFLSDDDAPYFKMLYDTLQSLYPHSDYVVALREEYEHRYHSLTAQTTLENISEITFPDLDMPDVNAQKRKLSSLKDKVVLVYFWTSTQAAQRMDNYDLRKWHDKYAEKGFEIYQVALDTDKPAWAKLIKEQNNPWINVCDGFGTYSPSVTSYNITSLPVGFIIDKNGQLVAGQLTGTALEKKLAALMQ